MSDTKEIRVPDIGDFDEVDVVEVHVQEGDEVDVEDSLITLESDKASLDVPASDAGTVRQVKVKAGDKVSQGDVILLLEPAGDKGEEAAADGERTAEEQKERAEGEDDEDADGAAAEDADENGDEKDEEDGDGPRARVAGTTTPADRRQHAVAARPTRRLLRDPLPDADRGADVVVLGAGPGGYTAAFRAADLGLKVILVDRRATLGGVCLNVGCIPSKAMLHAAAVVDEAAEFAERGIRFGDPEIDLEALNAWKQGVVDRLTRGLASMADKRGVSVVQGTGRFTGAQLLQVEDDDGGTSTVAFRSAIVAAGSRPVMLPDLPDDDRIMTSDEAIAFAETEGRMLVVGGGIIGLEMAQVYASLGADITVVELLDGLMPGADRDLVKPLERRLRKRYEAIYTSTKVIGMKASKKGIEVSFEGADAPETDTFDRVLVAVGRRPNGDRIDAAAAGLEVDERGFLRVDRQMRTNVEHIYAIGDIAGEPMLAHKASHEGKVAAEVIAGEPAAFDARVVPSVAYTDPEVAWVGLTEGQAEERGVEVEIGRVPWAASGRALGIGRPEGLTKMIFDRGTGRLVGAGIVGPHAGDLISEAALAVEMGAEAADIGLTIHPHPTLSETLALGAEIVDGTVTDLYLPKADRKRS